MISVEESREFFLTTLRRLDNLKLNFSDLYLEDEILEELSSEYISFLHAKTIDRLIENNLVSAALRPQILSLRSSIHELLEKKGTIQAYREDQQWQEARDQAAALIESCA